MNWKKTLISLEKAKAWDEAIEFMQKIISENPDDLDAYIGINYLLMNLLVEEDYDTDKHKYYAKLTKQYFLESYAKFSDNAEYLFYTGLTGCMSEWFFGLEREQVKSMMKKALYLEPENIIYQWIYYMGLSLNS